MLCTSDNRRGAPACAPYRNTHVSDTLLSSSYAYANKDGDCRDTQLRVRFPKVRRRGKFRSIVFSRFAWEKGEG
jgi:hypothetical protein